MAQNISVNHMSEVHLAAYLGDTERLENILKDNSHSVDALDDDGRTPFLYTCLTGNHDSAMLLMRFGANIFARSNHGYTALHLAAMQPDSHFLQWLIDEGLEIGRSPLHYACQSGHSEVTDRLLANRAIPNAEAKNGDQPMHMAARHHNLFCVRLLRDHHVNINGGNKLGCTPLHLACVNGDVMMVDYLLGHGSDASVVTMHNDTPFELVPSHQRDAMRDVFDRHRKDAIIANKVIPVREAKVSSRPSLTLAIPDTPPEKPRRRTPQHTMTSLGDDFSDSLEDSTDSENPSDVDRVDDIVEMGSHALTCEISDDGNDVHPEMLNQSKMCEEPTIAPMFPDVTDSVTHDSGTVCNIRDRQNIPLKAEVTVQDTHQEVTTRPEESLVLEIPCDVVERTSSDIIPSTKDDDAVPEDMSFKFSLSDSDRSQSEKGSDVFPANVISPSTLSTFSVDSSLSHVTMSESDLLPSQKDNTTQLRGILISRGDEQPCRDDETSSVVSDLTCEDDESDDDSLALSTDAAAVKIGTKSHSNTNSSFQSFSTSQGGNMSSNPSLPSTMSSSSATPQGESVNMVPSDHSDEVEKRPLTVPPAQDADSIKSLTTFSSHVSPHDSKLDQATFSKKAGSKDSDTSPTSATSERQASETKLTAETLNSTTLAETNAPIAGDDDSIKSLKTFGSHTSDILSEDGTFDRETLRMLAQSDSDTSSVFSIEDHPTITGITPRTECTESTVESAMLTYSPCTSPYTLNTGRVRSEDSEDVHEEEFPMSARLVSFSKLHPSVTEEKYFIDENPICEEGYVSEESEVHSLERYGDFTDIYADVPRTSAYFTEENPNYSDAESSVTVDMDLIDDEEDEDADSIAVEFDYDRKSQFNELNPAPSPSVDSHATEERLSGVSVSTINDDASHEHHASDTLDFESERSYGYSSDTPDVDSIVLSDRSVASYIPITVASPSPPTVSLTPLAQRIAMYNMATKKSTEKEGHATLTTMIHNTEGTTKESLLSDDPSLLSVKEKAAMFSKPTESSSTRTQRSAMIVGKLDMSALSKQQSPPPLERKPSHSSLIFDLISDHDAKGDEDSLNDEDMDTNNPHPPTSTTEDNAEDGPRLAVDEIAVERCSSSSLNYSPRVDEIPVERLSSCSSLQDTMFRPSSDSMLDRVDQRPSSASGVPDEELGFIPLLRLDKDLIDMLPEDDQEENEPLSSKGSRNKNRRRKSDGGITMRRTPRTPTSARRSSIGTGMRLSDTSASTDKSPRLSSTSMTSDGIIETHFTFTPTELEESIPEQEEKELIISSVAVRRPSIEPPREDIVDIDESFNFDVQEKIIPINLSARNSFASSASRTSRSISPNEQNVPPKQQRSSLPVLPLSPDNEESLVNVASVGRSRRSRSMFRASSRHTLATSGKVDIVDDDSSCCESVVTYDNHLLMSPTAARRKHVAVSSKSMSEADAIEPSIPRYHRSSSQHLLPVRTKFSYVEFGGSYKVNSKIKDKAAKEYALLATELSRGDEEIAAELRAWNALGPRAYMSQPEDTKSQLEKALDEIDSTSQGSLGSAYSASLNNFVDVSIQKTLEIQWRLSQLESKMYNASALYEIRRLLNKKTKLFQKLKSKITDSSVVMDLEEIQRLRSDINNVRRQCLNVIRQEVSICKDPESVIVEEYRTIANI